MNVFPSAVEGVVRAQPWLGGEYQLVLGQEGARQSLTIGAELAADQPTDSSSQVSAELAAALRAALRVPPAVELVPRGTLPRSEGKARRVVDERG